MPKKHTRYRKLAGLAQCMCLFNVRTAKTAICCIIEANHTLATMAGLVARADLLTPEYTRTIVHVLHYMCEDAIELYLCRVTAGERCITRIVDNYSVLVSVHDFTLDAAKIVTNELGFERALAAFKVREDVLAVVGANTRFMAPLVRMIGEYMGRWPWCDEDKNIAFGTLGMRELGMITYEHMVRTSTLGRFDVDIKKYVPCTVVDLRFCHMYARVDVWDDVADHCWDHDDALRCRVLNETAMHRHDQLVRIHNRSQRVNRTHVPNEALERALTDPNPNKDCLRVLVRLYGVTEGDMKSMCARGV